ncbi:hypothetical protein GQ54DRAFT_301255 [Martensiomyces pterosporus]|nr:hypothetical protein GQ54DRAFT_301255 [Martensiomyces pterosporus]
MSDKYNAPGYPPPSNGYAPPPAPGYQQQGGYYQQQPQQQQPQVVYVQQQPQQQSSSSGFCEGLQVAPHTRMARRHEEARMQVHLKPRVDAAPSVDTSANRPEDMAAALSWSAVDSSDTFVRRSSWQLTSSRLASLHGLALRAIVGVAPADMYRGRDEGAPVQLREIRIANALLENAIRAAQASSASKQQAAKSNYRPR